MDSLAITDHGGLYGAIDFYQTATAAGIKPIIGCELYVALQSRFDRTPEDRDRYHLTALAKNEAGYRNLIKLVTKANLEGYYYKPRVDRDLLEQHSEGLILLTGCPSGEVPSYIAQGRMDEAKRSIAWYRDRFPDYYLEVMQHDGVPELPRSNAGLGPASETGTHCRNTIRITQTPVSRAARYAPLHPDDTNIEGRRGCARDLRLMRSEECSVFADCLTLRPTSEEAACVI